MPRTTDDILQELTRDQAKLAELERARDEVQERIEALRSELAATPATTPLLSPLAVAAKCDVPSTHRKPLLEQWVAQLAMFLGIDEKRIGRIGGGKRKPNGRIDVAMLQSLVRKEEVDDLVAGYGHVIVDECHHVSAGSFERVLSEVKARYLIGLTATPQRRDGRHPITEMQFGPIRFRVDAKSQAARRPFDHKLLGERLDSKWQENTRISAFRRSTGRWQMTTLATRP
jgi:hypothetical protein